MDNEATKQFDDLYELTLSTIYSNLITNDHNHSRLYREGVNESFYENVFEAAVRGTEEFMKRV